MGFNARKSIKVGPFRVTASKSGVSYSAGAGPARVTRRADGRTTANVNLPGPVNYSTTLGGGSSNRTATGSSTDGADVRPLVEEAAAMLRDGSKAHQVDKMLRQRGLGMMQRGEILRDAKKMNRR